MIPLFVSVVFANLPGAAIGTILIPEGGQCGGAQPTSGLQYMCTPPTTCQYTSPPNPGGFGTCENPSLGVPAPSGVDGPCGHGDSPSMTTYRCKSGLECVHSGTPGSYGKCEQPNASLGAGVPAPSGLGGRCGHGDSPSMTIYRCRFGLECQHSGVPGSYGTCVNFLGASLGAGVPAPSPVNGPCGPGDSPSMPTYRCQSGLECVYSGTPGSYGKCEQPNAALGAAPQLGSGAIPSGLGGRCGTAGRYRPNAAYVCVGDNLHCAESSIAGEYGTCVLSIGAADTQLGASLGTGKAVYYSGEGGDCGWGDSPEMPEYICDYGLTCQSPPPHMAGSYGTCVSYAPSPTPEPSSGGEGAICGSVAGVPGYYTCDPDLVCVGGTSTYYGSCQQSYYPPANGRRLEAEVQELLAPLFNF